MGTTQTQPTPHRELAEVLDQITTATRHLRRADNVPRDVEELIESLDAKLHAEAPLRWEVDPYLATTLFAGALRAVKAVRHDDSSRRRRETRLALEQVRHALRDIIERAPVGADVPIRQLLRHLDESLKAPQADLAELLGVSTRQLQRWLSPEGPALSGDDEARVRIVATIVNHLRHVFTGPGVARWFQRSHPLLGQPPIELLDDPSRYPLLRDVAAGSRSM